MMIMYFDFGLIQFLTVLRCLLFSILYGVMENRYFFEGPLLVQKVRPYYMFGHFKLYHFLMFIMFCIIAYDPNFIIWIFCLIWMPFIQDSTWQLIQRRELQRDDWSNFGGLPLVFGIFVWYIVDVIITTLFGIWFWLML